MSPVRRRCVFYVSGFDPKGARHYHGLYRDESARQAPVSGFAAQVGPRRKLEDGNSAWPVRAMDDGVEVETHYEFMRWDDVVSRHWPRYTWQLWRDVVTTTLFNLRHGTLWEMYQLSWPPALALFVPFLLMLGVVLGIPVLGGLGGWAAWEALDNVWAGGIAAAVATAAVIWIGLALEARYSMYWMMRSYAFTARQAQGRTPDLEARLDQQAARLAQRLAEAQDDEVLVVGHSSGAIMAAAIVARALRLRPDRAAAQPVLSLLTLGQWIPLLGLLPQATSFRQELAELATAPGLDWIDFSAPPDGCCFALTDPIGSCGVTPAGRLPDRPKLLSPRFAEMFEPEAYQALRRDKFRLHFQYLAAAPRPVAYDYFRITAGARTLADRFSAQPSVMDFDRLRPFRHARNAGSGSA
jgi:hypothetical protein